MLQYVVLAFNHVFKNFPGLALRSVRCAIFSTVTSYARRIVTFSTTKKTHYLEKP